MDAIGGVEFEVPFDMDYDDPYQDLHIHQKAGQIIGIGGRADLVVHHRGRAPFLSDAEHGLNEVLSVDAEHPGNADDEKFLHQLLHRQLSLIFGLAVYV